MFIWGWADYDDVFAGTPRHRTEFCFRVEVIAGSDGQALVTFPIYSQFNAFDEECSRGPSQCGPHHHLSNPRPSAAPPN